MAGFGKGSADVELEAAGSTETKPSYVARATVGGKLAQVGSRLVSAAAGKVTEDFFKAFEAQLAAEMASGSEEPAPVPAQAVGNSWIWRVIDGVVLLAIVYVLAR